MKKCKTLDEALSIPGVVHVEVGKNKITAYVAGDELPAHCKPDHERADKAPGSAPAQGPE